MSYVWDLPTKVLFGPGKVKELANVALPGKKALLVVSCGKSVRTSGALEAVEKGLDACGVEHVLFDKIQANPLEPTIMEGVLMARENDCDFIIGLGGGSVMDSASVIAAIAPQKEGRVWDYVKGVKQVTEKLLPYVAITTTAGTGSEVDCWAVVSNPETREKIGFRGDYPVLAIVDPELMLTVPPALTAYQGFDALFHVAEGYIANCCNEAAEMVELVAIRNVAEYLPRAVKDGSDLEARTKVAYANTMGGYSMELSNCTSEHAMANTLSGYYHDLPHGAALILICEAYFSLWIERHACDERFVDMARAMGYKDTTDPMDFVRGLQKLRVECGVENLKMSDYGIDPEEFPAIARDARNNMGGLYGCDRLEITDEDVIEIFKKSYS